MTDPHAELDAALEQVVSAARGHLAAVKAAGGRIDDEDVWRAYVALNNASYEYDELLLDVFGEVTPWDVEAIDPDEAEQRFGGAAAGGPDDPYARVVSVRQRRDYRVPSVAALLRVADAARRGSLAEREPADLAEPVESVGEAVLELLQAGDGSLGALDVPELEPLDGVVAVAELAEPLDLAEFAEDDGTGPFQLGGSDRLLGRLDEHSYADLDLADDDLDDLDDDFDDLDENDEDENDEDEDEGEDEEDDDRRPGR